MHCLMQLRCDCVVAGEVGWRVYAGFGRNSRCGSGWRGLAREQHRRIALLPHGDLLPALVGRARRRVDHDVRAHGHGELAAARREVGGHDRTRVAEAERGVVVLIREPRPQALSNRVRRRLGEPVDQSGELRDYGIGAQILLDLGVQNMVLLSNHQRTIVGIEGFGLNIVEQRSIPLPEDR